MKIPIFEGFDSEGEFSRSAGCNRAAEAAGDWTTAIFLDSDVLLNLDTVQDGLELSKSTGRMVFPFREWKGLRQNITETILNDNYQGSWERGVNERYTDSVSACVIMPRDVWDTVGGYDERFQGWGWEDSAFTWAVTALTGRYLRLRGDMWHLWHEKQPHKDTKSLFWQANKRLAKRYQAAVHDPDVMRDILQEEGGPLA